MTSHEEASGVAGLPPAEESDDEEETSLPLTSPSGSSVGRPRKGTKRASDLDPDAWEGVIMARVEDSYGGKVIVQDIMAWCRPQFKVRLFCSHRHV
jgi:hypothetical protein